MNFRLYFKSLLRKTHRLQNTERKTSCVREWVRACFSRACRPIYTQKFRESAAKTGIWRREITLLCDFWPIPNLGEQSYKRDWLRTISRPFQCKQSGKSFCCDHHINFHREGVILLALVGIAIVKITVCGSFFEFGWVGKYLQEVGCDFAIFRFWVEKNRYATQSFRFYKHGASHAHSWNSLVL